MLNNNSLNHLTVCKQMSSDSSKNVTYKLFAYKLYMYKQDLALDYPPGLICHESQPNLLVFPLSA